MRRGPTWIGMVIGLFAGLVILKLGGTGSFRPPVPLAGPILSECDGHLRDLVIHYDPAARATVETVYREFLGALEADITVHVVCVNHAAFAELTNLAGQVRCRLEPVVVQHPITTWSRDRWVALAPAAAGQPTTIWSPRGEAAEEIWPARAGDERVGQDLAAALASSLRARRSNLYFDGGDFLADGDRVFVVSRFLPRNLQHTIRSREELLKLLAAELKRRIILLEASPEHHAGMFMASVGNHTMLVGDPALGRNCVQSEGTMENAAALNVLTNLPGGPDFSAATQQLFDAVAAQCMTAGYKVRRIPVVPAHDGRTYLTYCNALIDQQGRSRIVYLPTYRGVEPLNAAARAVWENLGYEIRPVDCTNTYRQFGCLHCLVNVLKRTG